MARPKGRGPQVEVRRHTSKDGIVSEYASVRYVDHDGVRKRLRCGTVAEAELERARIALEGAPAPPRALQGDNAQGAGTPAQSRPEAPAASRSSAMFAYLALCSASS